MTSKLKQNLFYNITLQLFNVLLPLLTIPYISRILGVENNGIYAYTYSIVNYFVLFAMLGINNYGNRRIAKVQRSKARLATEFLSIYTVQAILSVVAISVYLLYCLLLAEYRAISLVETIFLISVLFDVSWLYFGLEKFKKTTTRSIVVKIISFGLILALVHSADDLNIYTLIMASSTLISQLILWANIPKYVNLKLANINLRKIFSHFKGIIILFVPVISYSIYRIMDKIMLGAMYSVDEVAFYEYAEKIINLPVGIITAVGTVMMPRISNLVANQQIPSIKKYIRQSLELFCFLALPCCFGLIAISQNFITLFLGNAYAPTAAIASFLSLAIPFTAWANVIRTQWLIPNEKDSIYIYTTIIAAILNFLINFALIPHLGGIGAAIGTIYAEAFITLSQSFLCHKDLKFQLVLRPTIRFFSTALVMFSIIIFIPTLITNQIICIIVQIILGSTVYLGLNRKYVHKIFYQARGST